MKGRAARPFAQTTRFARMVILGSIVILMPKDDPWSSALQGLSMFTDDFLNDGVEDLPLQEREML